MYKTRGVWGGLAPPTPAFARDAQKRRIEAYAVRGQDKLEQIVAYYDGVCSERLGPDITGLGLAVADGLFVSTNTPRFVVANPCF